jgi:hypothetical protein
MLGYSTPLQFAKIFAWTMLLQVQEGKGGWEGLVVYDYVDILGWVQGVGVAARLVQGNLVLRRGLQNQHSARCKI